MNDMDIKRVVKHAAEMHGVSTKEVVDVVLGKDTLQEAARPRRGKGLWIMLALMLGLFAGAVWWLVNYLNAPVAAGPIKAPSLETARKDAAPTPSVLPTFGGKMVSFTYPGQFDAVTQLKADKRTVEAYTISSKADYRRVIQLAVRSLPSGNLDDESGFKFRTIKPAEYRSTAVKIMNEPAVLMTKVDNLEQTLFWPHGGMVVEIAISSSTQADDVVAYMKTITDTLRWRK